MAALRPGAIVLLSALVFLVAHGRALSAGPDCSREAVEADAAAAEKICGAMLGDANLGDEERVRVLALRARALGRLGRIDAAVVELDRAIALAPMDPELKVRRGWLAFDKGDLEAAFHFAEEAARIAPALAGIWDQVGTIMARADYFEPARAAYGKAIEIDPNDPWPRYHRFQLFEVMQLQREAIAEADTLLKLPSSVLDRPNAMMHNDKPASFRTAVGIDRAAMLSKMGRVEEAAQAYDDLARADRSALTLAWRASYNDFRNVPSNVVQADLDESLKLDPNYWFTHKVQGQVYFRAQAYEASAAEYGRAAALKPGRGDVHWWRSLALRKLGRTEEATQEALAAVENDRNFLRTKIDMLAGHGYLQMSQMDIDPMPAVRDAVRACVLDERCW